MTPVQATAILAPGDRLVHGRTWSHLKPSSRRPPRPRFRASPHSVARLRSRALGRRYSKMRWKSMSSAASTSAVAGSPAVEANRSA